MASYRGHLSFSTALGAAYTGVAIWQFGLDWASAVLGGILTAVGGMLPDLDSDSGVPVRELFGLAATIIPILMLRRLMAQGMTNEQVLVVLAGTYVLIRYGASTLFKNLTVHRGMFHSVPALLSAGLIVFLVYHDPNIYIRYLMAGGIMLGFLSHLVLDELCSVDLQGVQIKLNKFAGSALKFWSSSWTANLAAYSLLGGLCLIAALEYESPRRKLRDLHQQTLSVWSDKTEKDSLRMEKGSWTLPKWNEPRK